VTSRRASTVACHVIAKGRHAHLRRVLEGLSAQTRPLDEVVLVAIDDPGVVQIGEDTSVVTRVESCPMTAAGELPLARARNVGAAASTADLLVFLDVDCIPDRQLVADYERERRVGLLMGGVRYLPPGHEPGSPPDDDRMRAAARVHPSRPVLDSTRRTSRYELFWSLNFAVDRATWRMLGGFDDRFEGYGAEDTDLAYTARSRGVAAWFVAGAEAYHQHHPVSRPPVEHVDSIVRNACRFHQKWDAWPMEGWLRDFASLGLVEWDPAAPDPCLRRV
jgi:GT2 family glycosyltransferase